MGQALLEIGICTLGTLFMVLLTQALDIKFVIGTLQSCEIRGEFALCEHPFPEDLTSLHTHTARDPSRQGSSSCVHQPQWHSHVVMA